MGSPTVRVAARRAELTLVLRKRPAQARSVALVEAILQAAADILETAGLAALTTNEVAERAGVSIGSLYQYFPNKDAILVSLITRQEIALRAAVAASFAQVGPADLGSALRIVVGAAFGHHQNAPRLCLILEAEERRLGPLTKGELAGAEDQMSSAFGDFLARFLPGKDHTGGSLVRDIELIAQTLMIDAIRRGDINDDSARRIAALLTSCAEAMPEAAQGGAGASSTAFVAPLSSGT